ncbi:MAG: hypothetical protein FWH22_11425 [Fibromonadales bacterium]|nr:hypothetical protein [Fibromonadales bacterium]
MIIPMIKYDFVLYNADLPAFLEKLQTLGIVDTKRSIRPIDEHSTALLEEITNYNSVFKQLSKIKIENPEPVSHAYTAEHILKHTEKLLEDKEQTTLRETKLLMEIESARPWKTWSMGSIDRLSALKCTPHFYIVSEKKYKAEWEQEYPLAILNEEKGNIYLVVLEQEGEPYHFPLNEAKLPSASIDLLEEELRNIEQRLEHIQQEFEKYALSKELLMSHRSELITQLDLYLAGKGTASAAEDKLAIVTAFVPEPQKQILDDFITQEQELYLCEAAKIEDNPPIKLKNNRFARLFEPIGDMFMPPLYNELDVTAFFAPFYMLFFGFCLGDIGYGIILLLVGTLGKFFMPKMKPILSLVQFLGVGTIILPLLSGTFFGLKLGLLFNIEGVFFDDLQMFWLAIAFGGVHIIFAKLVNTFDAMFRKGFQHGLAPLGWALGLIAAALYAGQSFLSLPIPVLWIKVSLFLGIALILFFTSLSKNIFIRPLKALASIMDVTGIFGDLLSYIRLFGLGAAGGILGFVVNTVGGMVWNIPFIGYLFGGIVFVVGHVAVMALSSLGALVHPMRLTFVEFYKNVGFTGGGRPYKPLTKIE